MKRSLRVCLLLIVLPLIAAPQIPHTLSYQGILTDSSGNPKPDGDYQITFNLYGVSSGGNPIWSEQKTFKVKRGLFSTILGDLTVMPESVKFDQPYWLGIKVGADPELSPRVPLSSVAYSLNSSKADTAAYARSAPAGTIPDNAITSAKIADGSIQRADVAANFQAPYADTAFIAKVALGDTTWKTTGSDIYRLNGYVGIGTSSPLWPLEISTTAQNPFTAGSNHTVGTWVTLRNTAAGGTDWSLISTGPDNGEGAGNFLVRDNGNNFVAMTFLGNGNVGIGTITPEAPLTVKGPGTFRGNHIAYFENTSGVNGDGIAIQIDHAHTNSDNNFLTFYNGSGSVTGRVEGFDYENGDWVVPPPMPAINPSLHLTFPPAGSWFDPGTLPTASLIGGSAPGLGCTASIPVLTFPTGHSDVCTAWTLNPGSFPGLSFDAGTLPSILGNPVIVDAPPFSFNQPTQQEVTDLICWGLTAGESDLFSLAAIGSMFGAAGNDLYLLHAQSRQICKDEGVTYGSKGADYAEWLEKADPNEDIRWGQIVGVRAGKITKVTKGAEQIMIVSRAPIVLGNQPPEDNLGNYKRVAFMGQVHAVVSGPVHAGDYILASGLDDGMGVAVPPGDLKVEHLDRIVGRAWEKSGNASVNFVNVVVGVNHEATTDLLTAQSRDHATLKAENESLRTQIAELKAGQARTVALLERLEKTIGASRTVNSSAKSIAPRQQNSRNKTVGELR